MLYLANNRLLLINNGNSLYRIDSQTQPEPDSDSFIFTIDTSLGTGDSFDLPLRSEYNYDMFVDWGDGSSDAITSYNQTEKLHTYSTGGIYTITITGLCEAWYFNNGGDRLKLTTINQWGDTGFINMFNAFWGCSNLTSINDTDGTWCSNVTNMNGMFDYCSSLATLDVSNWDVSNVTHMYGMGFMFNGCSRLSTLDVSNWNVSNVTYMAAMFQNCSSLTTLDVSNWNVSNVTNMYYIFNGCSRLSTLDVSNWNVSNVTDMSGMFRNCPSLATLDVSNWNTSAVTTMNTMFYNCSSLTTLNLSGWNVENVLPYVYNNSMYQMFTGCPLSTASYDAALIAWSLQNVQSGVRLDAPLTQYSCAANDAHIELTTTKGWTVNDLGLNVANCDEPITDDSFKFTINTNLGTGDSFNLPLRSGYNYNFVVDWGDGNTNTITSYNQAEKLHTYSTGGEYQIKITGLCESWYFNYIGDASKLKSIDQWGNTGFRNMQNAFMGCSNLTTANDTDGTWCSNVTNMFGMFNVCSSLTTLNVSNWDVFNVSNMQTMFNGCSSLATLDVSNWNVSNVTIMGNMFSGCSYLTTLDVNNWNVSNVSSMYNMFWNCSSLTTLDVSNWNVSNVTIMGGMFRDCSSLATLDVSNWDISKVTDMIYMFGYCSSLTTLDVSNWNVSNVTDMGGMFRDCSSLATLDVSNWDISKVTDMGNMFSGCSYLTTLDVSDWNVSNVSDMQNMFFYCISLTTLDLSNWDVSNVNNMSYMFYNTPLNTTSYDALLIGWSGLPSLQSNVRFDANLAKYSSGEATTAREILTSTPNNWIIYDAGPVI